MNREYGLLTVSLELRVTATLRELCEAGGLEEFTELAHQEVTTLIAPARERFAPPAPEARDEGEQSAADGVIPIDAPAADIG